jgi:hypothetical protein
MLEVRAHAAGHGANDFSMLLRYVENLAQQKISSNDIPSFPILANSFIDGPDRKAIMIFFTFMHEISTSGSSHGLLSSCLEHLEHLEHWS